MAVNPDSLSGVVWRVAQLEHTQEMFQERKLPEAVQELRKEIERVDARVEALRNALLAFGFSVLAAAVVFALTMIALFGNG